MSEVDHRWTAALVLSAVTLAVTAINTNQQPSLITVSIVAGMLAVQSMLSYGVVTGEVMA